MTIDWTAWDLCDEFAVFDAACLWLEIEPTGELFGANPPNISAMMDAIEQHAGGHRQSRISSFSIRSSEPEINWDAYLNPGFTRQLNTSDRVLREAEKVTRDALLKMADKLRQKPKFLFPEEREEDNQSSLKTARKIILALLKSKGIDPTVRGASVRIQEIMDSVGEKPLSANTIIKFLRFLND